MGDTKPSEGKTIPAIHAMFFLSGVGALVFENVWFNQLGLIVGNSVWSAALARRWGNLVRCYGMLEAAAAVSGALLVFAFPSLPAFVRPLLAPFLDDATLLNAIRIVVAFGLMVVLATALGTTLPLWLLESEARKVGIAGRRAATGGALDPQAAERLAIDALANRRSPTAHSSPGQSLAAEGYSFAFSSDCAARSMICCEVCSIFCFACSIVCFA